MKRTITILSILAAFTVVSAQATEVVFHQPDGTSNLKKSFTKAECKGETVYSLSLKTLAAWNITPQTATRRNAQGETTYAITSIGKYGPAKKALGTITEKSPDVNNNVQADQPKPISEEISADEANNQHVIYFGWCVKKNGLQLQEAASESKVLTGVARIDWYYGYTNSKDTGLAAKECHPLK